MDPALKDRPSKLFVELTTRCNLKCGMCVKQSANGCIDDGDLSRRHFAALEEAMPGLEALLLNGIGEPLLHADLDRFISRARKLMPREGRIGFQTNGFFIDEPRALSLVRAGTDRVCVSVDGSSVDTFRAVRGKGDPGIPGRALMALSRAARSEGMDGFSTGIEFVAMKENIGELAPVLKWGAAHGIRFAIVTQLLPYDESMADHIAYDTNTDAARISHRGRARRENKGSIFRVTSIFS